MTLKDEPIKNKTAILFDALPTCNTNTDCESCVISSDTEYDDLTDPESQTHKLGCRWCAALNRCSDGTDRNRQEWLKNKCDNYNVSKVESCDANNRQVERDPSLTLTSFFPDLTYPDTNDHVMIHCRRRECTVLMILVTRK